MAEESVPPNFMDQEEENIKVFLHVSSEKLILEAIVKHIPPQTRVVANILGSAGG